MWCLRCNLADGFPSVQLYVGVSQEKLSTEWSTTWSIKRGVRESEGWAEVHGRLDVSAQHFLDVPIAASLNKDVGM
jgi:hypothetical protein